MKKMLTILLLCILLFVSSCFIIEKTYAAACPLPGDTKVTNDATNPSICYSVNDPTYFNAGLNTQGGTRSTCNSGGLPGQVNCPGDTTSPYGIANDCIKPQINAQGIKLCYAGHGTSGYDTPDCVPADPNTPLTNCPSPMTLRIHFQDIGRAPLKNTPIPLTIIYEDVPIYAPPPATPPINQKGKTITNTFKTDDNGDVVIAGDLYSGDHFVIIPQQSNIFTPTQIGSTNDRQYGLGDQEMNTTFSCGTQLENGTETTPCTFTLNPGITLVPNQPPLGQLTPDTLVNDTIRSAGQTMITLGGIVLVAGGIVAITANARVKKGGGLSEIND